MIRSTGVPSAPFPRTSRPPLRLSVFVLFSWFDVIIVAAAVLAIVDSLGLLPPLSGSGGYVEVWGSRYTLDPPTFPWIVGALSALTVVVSWFAVNGRRFALVFAVALAWVVLGLAAIATGSGDGLFLQRSFLALLLFTSRSWFIS